MNPIRIREDSILLKLNLIIKSSKHKKLYKNQ